MLSSGFSRKKLYPPPFEDVNGKFHGVEWKSLQFQGVHPKVEERTWISREVDAKKWKIPGGRSKFDGDQL